MEADPHSYVHRFSLTPFPRYGTLGIVIIIAAEMALALRVYLVGIYFTPIVWTGYLLVVDALTLHRNGYSMMTSKKIETVLMAVWSVVCWSIFEAYNLYLKNWTYVGLPDNILFRYIGYVWSFATIFPAILLTAILIEPRRKIHDEMVNSMALQVQIGLIVAGLVCLALPLVVGQNDANKLFALVWLGFFLVLDPINSLLGGQSILRDIVEHEYSRFIALVCSGLLCGVLWEFWNYWAVAKWIYSVHISFAGPKLFEMPMLGYLGFIAFAFECFAMYELLPSVIPSVRKRRVA